MGEFKAVDLDALLTQFGGDDELLGEIIEIFLDDHVEQIRQIRDAIQSGDAGSLEVAAHTLKGSISNFGAEAARDTAFALEKMGRDGLLDGAETVFDALLKRVSEVTAALENIRNAA